MKAIWLLAGITVLLALVLITCRSQDAHGEPLTGAAELSELSDDRLEGAVLTELGRACYGEGARADAWRGLHSDARQLWAVAHAPRDIGDVGLTRWLQDHAQEASTPGPDELADGLTGMGLEDAATVASEIRAHATHPSASTDLGRVQERLFAALVTPVAVQTRQAWVRSHLHDLLGRE